MKKAAYTLLELIVIMSVSGSLLGMGVVGLISYRSYTQLQNAYSDVVSIIRKQQNRANNSSSLAVLSGQAPYLFALNFNNNNYSLYYCQQASQNNVTCLADTSQGLNSQLANNNSEIVSSCAGIGFLKLSADILSLPASVFTSAGLPVNTGTCTIQVKHKQTLSTKNIVIDLATNSLTLQ
jgi:type II secretory pathway pseudopilin PulG